MVLYCNFTSLAFLGLLGFLRRQLNIKFIATLLRAAKLCRHHVSILSEHFFLRIVCLWCLCVCASVALWSVRRCVELLDAIAKRPLEPSTGRSEHSFGGLRAWRVLI